MNVIPPRQLKAARQVLKTAGAATAQAMGESPLPDARWDVCSHGGVIGVESPHPDLFERKLVYLPKPASDPDVWARRCGQRIKCLDTHLQSSSMGRVIRQSTFEAGMVAVIMVRRGVALSSVEPGDLDESQVSDLLLSLLTDLDRYLELTRDTTLAHLSAIELARIPQKGERPLLRLKLDAMALVAGLPGPSRPLSIDQLLAGVCRIWSQSIRGWGRIGQPQLALIGPWWAQRRASELSRSLRGLAERLERAEPTRGEVVAWLKGIS